MRITKTPRAAASAPADCGLCSTRKLEFGVKAVGGDGIGRYGSAQLADATARPDGTLALIRTGHGLARLEWHATPKFDLYAYWGVEYAWRAGYQGYNAVTVTKTAAIPATPPTADQSDRNPGHSGDHDDYVLSELQSAVTETSQPTTPAARQKACR